MQLYITLPKKSNLPIYVQVSEAIKDRVDRGVLKPGDRMPSIRELAVSLDVARLTINRAYEHLASQGYISVVQGRGTFVLDLNGVVADESSAAQVDGDRHEFELSPWAMRVMQQDSLASSTPDIAPELNYSAALLPVLPLNLWRKALLKSTDMDDLELLSYTADPLGFKPLREALAAYLRRARHLNCSPEQIVIFCHTEAGTDKLARLLLGPGDLVGVEEPGSPGVRTTFFTHGARLLSLPVDDEGIVVDTLIANKEAPRLIYLTPSHHDPTGVALSLERRQALLDWAQDKDCFIIEDDYDCEYYYGQRTMPALMSMDKNDRVIYRFNFWKSLFPLVRMGFLVLPKPLVPVMRRAKMLTERDNSLLEQKALAAFISLGYFERHVSRTRSIYQNRRAAVLHAITKHCKKEMRAAPTTAGTHVLAHFAPELREEDIRRCALSCGVPLLSTRQHYAGEPKANEFIVAFAPLQEEEADRLFREFGEMLRKL